MVLFNSLLITSTDLRQTILKAGVNPDLLKIETAVAFNYNS